MNTTLIKAGLIACLAATGCSDPRSGAVANTTSPQGNTRLATSPRALNSTVSPALANQLFVTSVSDAGVELTRVDVSAPLTGPATTVTALLPGSAGQTQLGPVSILSATLGVAITAEPTLGQDPNVHFFSPGAADIQASTRSSSIASPRFLAIRAPSGTFDSSGDDVTAFIANSPVGWALVNTSRGLELFIAFANHSNPVVLRSGLSQAGSSNPGAIMVYAVSNLTGSPALRHRATILSRSFSPAHLSVQGQGAQQRLILASTGAPSSLASLGQNATLEVFDPESLAVTAEIDLGPFDALGALNVSDNAQFGHIVGTRAGQDARIFEIDLASHQLARSVDVPYATIDATAPPSVASSASAGVLYVLLPGDRALLTVDRITGVVREQRDLAIPGRSGPGDPSDLPLALNRRPGDSASTLFIVISPLSAGNQVTLGANTAIDLIAPSFQ
jgi:hypothetical protein